MPKRGPKPRPAALKVLAGTRTDRVNRAGPSPPPGMPDRPDHLDRVALAEWDRVVPLLCEAGILARADGAALAIYCRAFSRWINACEDVDLNGTEVATEAGSYKKSPAAEVAVQAEGIMLKVLGEFGMTPSSRSRVAVAGEPPKDELGDFLARRGH